jgi:DNA-binding ferritin-like protein
MASVAHDAHLPALEHHGREEAGRELQATLVELVDLSLIGKQLHWNIFGRPFKPLHDHLHELVDSWRDLADTVAERAVALGVAPDGQAARSAPAAASPPSRAARSTRTRRSASLSRRWPTLPSASAHGWIGSARSTWRHKTS